MIFFLNLTILILTIVLGMTIGIVLSMLVFKFVLLPFAEWIGFLD